jgi:hypothetical protein
MINILVPVKFEAIMPLIDENYKILNGLIHRYESETLK